MAQLGDDQVSVEHWRTIAVAALPSGWRNAYKDEDDGTFSESPCPAVLVEEKTGWTTYWDVEHNGKTHRAREPHYCEPPFDTRVSFAAFDGAELYPASDDGNYWCALAPGEPLPEPNRKE